MGTPLFSIVIPTYNRSELVQGAVRSVLAQTFEDFEVVVSDNCSQDDTREVVGSFQDPRVRYVRTPRHGVIAESWEFARCHARGSLVMMLSDDDALVRDTLARFAGEHRRHDAEFLFCNLAEYRDTTFPGPEQNTVHCPPFTGSARTVSHEEFLKPLFAFRPKFNMHPSAFMFSSRVAARVVQRCGHFFQTNGVEYFAWPLAAVLSKCIVHIDAPLVVLGRTAKSWGSNIVLANPGKQQIEKMIADVAQNRNWIPLTNFTLANLMAEGLLLGKQKFPDELRPFPFDEAHYLTRTMAELRRRRAMGVDVDSEMAELLSYVDEKYPQVKADVLGTPEENNGHMWAARKWASAIGLSRVWRRLDDLRDVRRIKRGEIRSGFSASGKDLGFEDAVGCAEFLWTVTSPVR